MGGIALTKGINLFNKMKMNSLKELDTMAADLDPKDLDSDEEAEA